MKKTLLWMLLLSIFGIGCADDNQPNEVTNEALDRELRDALEAAGGTDRFILPDSDDLDAIPQDPLNPLSREKVQLGQFLFHETGLALNPKKEFSRGTYSCASCHMAGSGFQPKLAQGIADGGIGFGDQRVRGALYHGDDLDVQPVRTPSALNGAFQKNMLWNGQFGGTGANIGTEDKWNDFPLNVNALGYEGLEVQAIAGLKVHRQVVDETFFNENPIYVPLFDAAFPDVPTDLRYTREFAGLAIAAYERTIMANRAPFQEWLRGRASAMTDAEKEGAILFFTKANCSGCHTGPALNDEQFHAIGMGDLDQCPEEIFQTNDQTPAHQGRASFTGRDEDRFKFKTPQLYNLTDSPFYGHGAGFRSLREVVAYKNSGIAQNPRVSDDRLSEHFRPLNLTGAEIDALTEFLMYGLNDNNLLRYQPEALPTGNCFPNADPLSRSQMGCE